MTRHDSGRTLRARLALLYAALFVCSGIALLVLADLPLVGTGTARRAGGGVGGQAHARSHSTSNLPGVLLYSGIALAVLALLSVALGWLVADRALRPLRTITAAASAISASNLDERLNLGGDSYNEFRQLGATLDELFARLKSAFDSQRHFVANASHELRTPLAAERTVLQVALADPDANADSLRSACQQLLVLGEQQERLIDALLALAMGQRGLQEREPVDLAEVTGRIVRDRVTVARDQGVSLDAGLAPAIATGDANLVESLVANLVDNAIRHNVANGSIQIVTTSTAGRACFSISNTGPVVSAGEVGRLFEPFQQLEEERTRHDAGHGLGLAIVQSIVVAHGASLSARPRPDGGLDITVSFPQPSMAWAAAALRSGR